MLPRNAEVLFMQSKKWWRLAARLPHVKFPTRPCSENPSSCLSSNIVIILLLKMMKDEGVLESEDSYRRRGLALIYSFCETTPAQSVLFLRETLSQSAIRRGALTPILPLSF